MRHPIPMRPASVLALFLALSAPVASGGADVVAEVAGIPVTRFELQRQKQKLLPMEVGFHGRVSAEKSAEVEAKALNALIEQAYKVRYALDREMAIDNAAVEEKMQAVRKRFPDDQTFAQALGGEGIGAFRASIYRELLARKVEQEAIDRHVKVGDEEVRAYYRQHEKNYRRPKQFTARHILVKVDPSSTPAEREAAARKAEELLARARKGEDFYNLAYYNSDDRSKYVGGNLGAFHQGQTVKEFEEALLKMRPGEIAGPVRTLYGYHIIKLDAVEPPRQLSFEEVRGKIRQTLEESKREAAYNEWMAGLKARYSLKTAK